MRRARLAVLLILPVAIVAALVALTLPRQMNDLTAQWADRAARGRAATAASLVAADVDFDDAAHARESLALIGGSGDVARAELTRADGTVLASWEPVRRRSLPSMSVSVPVAGAGGAAGRLTLTFTTADLTAQTARNDRTGLLIAILVLALGAGSSVALAIMVFRTTRAEVRRELQQGFDRLVEGLPDAIMIHRGGRLSYVNARCREMLVPGDGVRGTPVADMTNPPLSSIDEGRVTAVHSRGGAYQVEVSRRPIVFAGVPSELIVVRDVSERERMRTRLDVTQRMASVGSLAAGVAHEINNPLTVIMGNLELLTMPDVSPEESREAALEALDATERVRRIVGDLRRLTRGDDDDQPAPFAIAMAVERAASLSAAEVRHRARLVIDTPAQPHFALGSEHRLVQVLVNLMVNAAHAMPCEDGANEHTIRVSWRQADGQVELQIVDDGDGMAPAILARVFDPFFTTKAVGQGTGLGLAICHSLMQAMQGTIVLTSAPGAGTTAILTLPAAARIITPVRQVPVSFGRASTAPVVGRASTAPVVGRASTAPVIGRAPTAPGVGTAGTALRPRILIVDDEPQVRASLARMLDGCAVTLVDSGAEAIAAVRRGERFELILCDVLMPQMSGLAMRAGLAEHDATLVDRLVFMTGGVDHRADGLGATPCLRKPFSGAELSRFVSDQLDRIAA